MADGSIKVDVDIEVQKAEKQLQDLKDNAKSSGDEIENAFDLDIDNLEIRFEKARNKIEETKNVIKETSDELNRINEIKSERLIEGNSIEVLRNNLNELRQALSSGLIDETQFKTAFDIMNQSVIESQNKIRALNQEILTLGDNEKLTAKLTEQNRKLDEQNLNFAILGNSAEKLSDRITIASDKTSQLNNETKKVSGSMSKASKNAGNMTNGISKGISKLGKYALALFSIRTAYQTLRKLSNQWLNSDDAGAKQVKANIQAMSSALSNALAPVITYIANLMATVFGYANAILKTFFGIDLLAKKTSKNTSGIASGTKKARKEAERFSSAFDKADIATGKISENLDGGGGGGGMDLPAPIIPTPDISGITKAFDMIKEAFKKVWDSDYVQSVFNSLKTITKNYFDFFKSVSGNIWDNLVKSFNQVLPIYIEALQNVMELWRLMLEDLAVATTSWLPIIADTLNSFVDSIFDTFTPLIVFITTIWRDFWGIILKLWKKHGKPLLDVFFGFVNATIDIFNSIWSIIDAIFSPLLGALQDVWESTLKDMVFEVLDFVAELIIAVGNIYNNFIAPIIRLLTDVLQPIFAVVFGAVSGIVAGAVNAMITTFRPLADFFKGIVQIISGIFSADWKKIWQGAVSIVDSIFGSIVNVVRIPLNYMIDLLNGFIRGLNRIKIPNWVPGLGGKGININPIPRLARGGFASSGSMQAIIGENGSEVALPLTNNVDAWANPLSDILSSKIGSGGDENINLIVDGNVLARVTRKEEEKRSILVNGVAYGIS